MPISLRRILPLAGVLLAVPLAGCATSTERASTGTDDVTSVGRSDAKQQAISNCWLYSTAAWTESLHLRASKEQLDVSEAYWSYFHWFDQIAEQAIDSIGDGRFSETGSYGMAAEYMRRRGWMSETDFLPEDDGKIFSIRQQIAIDTIEESLGKGGKLESKKARADRALVIAELNRAWGLSPEVARALAKAFGPTYDRTLQSADVTLDGTKIRRPSDIAIGDVVSGGKTVALTMADAIGAPADGQPIAFGARVGPYAWSDVRADQDFAKGGRKLVIRAQRALNQGAPVIMSWWADETKLDEAGRYRKTKEPISDSVYGHAVLVVDYEVDAPGFGVLPAGKAETRPEALAASLLPEAKVSFFRIKNSAWGSYDEGATVPFSDGVGYQDVDLVYLRQEAPIWGESMLSALVLPNDPDLVLGPAQPTPPAP